MQDRMRERMPTLPEDLSEYARIHTGPGSWSETSFEPTCSPDTPTPRPPYVQLTVTELVAEAKPAPRRPSRRARSA